MRTIARVAAAAAALSMLAAPTAAQVPGVDVSFVPRVGFYSAAADLDAASDAAGQVIDDRGGALAVGANLDISAGLLPVAVRVGFDYVTGSEFTYEEADASLEATGEQTMLAIAGDVVLRPIPRLIILQPYLLAGAGVKRYEFEFSEVPGSTIEEAFPDSRTDFTLHAGIGVDLGLGPIGLVAELSDYISWYEPEGGDSEMQHDLFVTAGVRLGIF